MPIDLVLYVRVITKFNARLELYARFKHPALNITALDDNYPDQF